MLISFRYEHVGVSQIAWSCRPRLGEAVVVLGWFHKAKALGDFSFDEQGGPLESALRILIVDGVVMLRWVFTTFQNGEQQLEELCICVVGIVHVSVRLDKLVLETRIINLQIVAHPVSLVEHHSSKTMGTCSGETWWATDETLIHDSNLQEVLGQGTRI